MAPTPSLADRTVTTAAAAPSLPTGVVLAEADGAFEVACDGRPRPARVAVSCLVRPEVGDIVACHVSRDATFIVAILERVERVPMRVVLGRDAVIEAGDSLEISAPARLALRADKLDTTARETRIDTGSLTVGARIVDAFAEQCHAALGRLTSVGEWWTTVFDRVVHRAGSHSRSTAGLDRVEAQTLQLEAEALVDVHAPHVLTTGETLVKTRGAQIHFG